MRVPSSSSASRRPRAIVDLPDPDRPVKNTTSPRRCGGPGIAHRLGARQVLGGAVGGGDVLAQLQVDLGLRARRQRHRDDSVLSGSCSLASARLVTTAGPASPYERGSSTITASSSLAVATISLRSSSGPRMVTASAARPPSSSRTSPGYGEAGRTARARGAQAACTGPAVRPSGSLGDGEHGERHALGVEQRDLVAGGRPSGRWSVTGAGHGVPSASVPRSCTVCRSSWPRNPLSGWNAPESSSSRSASSCVRGSTPRQPSQLFRLTW